VLGVSKDPVAAQAKFKAKYELPFPLLSAAYGVIKDKSMYGKVFKGIERSTFIIDAEGRVAKIFQPVKVAGHAGAVLDEL
jgi:peroxiredoxin Q/BCP